MLKFVRKYLMKKGFWQFLKFERNLLLDQRKKGFVGSFEQSLFPSVKGVVNRKVVSDDNYEHIQNNDDEFEQHNFVLLAIGICKIFSDVTTLQIHEKKKIQNGQNT